MLRPRAVAILVASIALAVPASAQQEEVRTIKFKGREIVCHILHSNDLEPVLTLEAAAEEPEKTVIFVLGDPRVLGDLNDAIGLKRFLVEGGNLLIATDQPVNQRPLGFRIRGDLIRVPDDLRDFFAYKGQAVCPVLTHRGQGKIKVNDNPPLFLNRPGEDVHDHPLFAFMRHGIATNGPSDLVILDGDPSIQELLVFPFFDGWQGIVGRQRPSCYIAGSPKNAPPRGRALYIAGHGMFWNGMILQPDNDNYQFTENAVRWLREGPDRTTRTKALLIVDGEIVTDFDMKLTPPLPPIPIPPLKMLNRLIRGLEDERFFHRVLNEALGGNAGRVCAVIAAIATILLLFYGAKKFLAGRQHLDITAPSMLGPQPPMSATTPTEERQQAMLRQIDFWEEARFLVLKWFRQELDVTPHRWRPEVDAAFQAEGFFLTRWRLQRQADFVLRLAQEAERVRVSRHEFFVLVESLREMSEALKDGRLALLVEGNKVMPGG